MKHDTRTLLMLPSGEAIGDGDAVDVRLTVTVPLVDIFGRLVLTTPNGLVVMGAVRLEQLAEAGAVSLVRRAEPDWQDGDLGKHRETGELYLYRPDFPRAFSELRPWFHLLAPEHTSPWRTAEEMLGKLVRCTVTPEESIP